MQPVYRYIEIQCLQQYRSSIVTDSSHAWQTHDDIAAELVKCTQLEEESLLSNYLSSNQCRSSLKTAFGAIIVREVV